MPVALRPFVALLVVAVAGCDSAPGFATESPRPTLSQVEVSPVAFALDTDAPTATVPLVVRGTIAADGPVEVRVLVRYAETDSLAAEAVGEFPGGGRFEIEAPVSLPRGAIGDYSVRVSTEGTDGRAGDQASAVLRFSSTSLGPPAVGVNAAPAVDRPTGDATVTVPLVATVTDPDGRANIAVVIARLPEGGGTIGRLFDDGNGEDEDEDDGVYSAGVVVDASFEPGTYELEVVAFDRAGEASDPVPYTFTVR